MTNEIWDIQAARISTNVLMASVAEKYFKERWKEFFPFINLREFIFTKKDLYVAIWDKNVLNSAINYSKSNLGFIKGSLEIFEKEILDNWVELKIIEHSLVNKKDDNLKDIFNLHKDYLKLWGKQTIYTVLARIFENALINALKEKGFEEEKIYSNLNPLYKGAQFYLNFELKNLAKQIKNSTEKELIIDNLNKGNFNSHQITKKLSEIKDEYGWIKAYINFYKSIETKNLVADLNNFLLTDQFEDNPASIPKSKLNFDEDTRFLFSLLESVVNMKNKTQNFQSYVFYLGHFLYKGLAESLEINLFDLEWFFEHEIDEIILNNVRFGQKHTESRKKSLLISVDNNLKFFLDEEEIKNVMSENGIDLTEHLKSRVDVIKGTFINPRKIEGEVSIVLSHEDLVNCGFSSNKILVTRAVTPEYTPYLNKFKAVIADEGGMASHGAIVAREMDIPMIVGAQGASSTLKNGQKIILNTNGFVDFS